MGGWRHYEALEGNTSSRRCSGAFEDIHQPFIHRRKTESRVVQGDGEVGRKMEARRRVLRCPCSPPNSNSSTSVSASYQSTTSSSYELAILEMFGRVKSSIRRVDCPKTINTHRVAARTFAANGHALKDAASAQPPATAPDEQPAIVRKVAGSLRSPLIRKSDAPPVTPAARALQAKRSQSQPAKKKPKAPSSQPERASTKPEPVEPQSKYAQISLAIDKEQHLFSALLLRDLCQCSACVDPSTKQKSFSTTDIPTSISARAVSLNENGASILWNQDIPGFDRGHITELSSLLLRNLASHSTPEVPYTPAPRTVWDAASFEQVQDIDYEAYMNDDAVLHSALQQLHTHGLLFLQNVPDSPDSVSIIGERIGPLKNTFYGYTWDVRSVPDAKNVAYTSQHLGFHMDLLYMQQPPHLQLLHCIRSSAQGGASLFTDSYKAARDLYATDFKAFDVLARMDTHFHYNHPASNLYSHRRPVLELQKLRLGASDYKTLSAFEGAWNFAAQRNPTLGSFDILRLLDSVAWSPPFQGPFLPRAAPIAGIQAQRAVGDKIEVWHQAAQKFSALIHRPEEIYERLMRPGECVVFDNRRVLHARKAFVPGDAGSERWLRGAYLDRDPYLSKLRVLENRFGNVGGVKAAAAVDGEARAPQRVQLDDSQFREHVW